MARNRRSKQHYRNLASGNSGHGAHSKPPCVRHIPQAQLAPRDTYQIITDAEANRRLTRGYELYNKENPRIILIR